MDDFITNIKDLKEKLATIDEIISDGSLMQRALKTILEPLKLMSWFL